VPLPPTPSMTVTSTRLDLDDKAYADACQVLSEALRQIMNIQADCAGRGKPMRPTQLVLMHFDRAYRAGDNSLPARSLASGVRSSAGRLMAYPMAHPAHSPGAAADRPGPGVERTAQQFP
jgi:hypothetical protein